MASSMDTSNRMPDLREHERRKPSARGTTLQLADGQRWLLANPAYRPGADSLTTPCVDGPIDRIFEGLVLEESLSLADIWEAARVLLKANYHLDDRELASLLGVEPGAESQRLASAVLEALFGSDQEAKSYSDWVRASLHANGLAASEIPARDLPHVLAILVATQRTVPLSRFADVCKKANERASLETLI